MEDHGQTQTDGCVRHRQGHQDFVFYELGETQNRPVGPYSNYAPIWERLNRVGEVEIDS